jgi:hypothetical protein
MSGGFQTAELTSAGDYNSPLLDIGENTRRGRWPQNFWPQSMSGKQDYRLSRVIND